MRLQVHGFSNLNPSKTPTGLSSPLPYTTHTNTNTHTKLWISTPLIAVPQASPHRPGTFGAAPEAPGHGEGAESH